ncbi:MAG: FecR family protein [Elusimicrobiota bacterium]|nr:FecR family protein [Elusimicrobiota bacterium]
MKKILLALALCSSVYAQEAFIMKTSGKAYLNSGGIWQAVKKDMLVTAGNSITTENGASVTLRLSDGHTIEIRGDSIFSLGENSENLKEMDIWLGRLLAKVEKLPPGRKFTVRTPAAVCAVRGTKFTVDVNEDKKTDVYVDKGIVGVMDSSGAGEEIFVKKGMMSSVEQGGPASKPVKKKAPSRKTAKKAKKEKREKARRESRPRAEIESFGKDAPAAEPVTKAARRAPSSSGMMDMNGSIGAVALTRDGVTKVYYEFSMFPELTFGKLGIGLELVVHFDENNQILKDEWKKEKYPEKIDYIRWGHKHQDPFYFLIGRFRRPVSIGHGFIVNSYSNMARYPNVKKIGLEFDLDMNKWGLEAMTDDVTRADIIGGRFYMRPLLETGIPLIRNLKIAASAGTDRDPDAVSDTKDDAVTVIGADAELPLFSFKYFKTSIYGDVAKMRLGDKYKNDNYITGISTTITDGGTGKSAGLSGKLFFLNFRGEYRIIEDNFIPGYFDGHYDLDRWMRFSVTDSSTTKAVRQLWGRTKDPVKVGPYIEAWFSFFRVIDFRASYENYNTVGDNDPFYPHLIASATMAKLPMLDNYTLEADYDKKGARTWNDIKKVDENAILAVKVGYRVAPNVTMLIVSRRNYDSAGNPTKSMTAETRIRF